MKLSVIIVSYNEKEYIEEAIDSCLNQICDIPFEIIIGDDGSNDGSVEIIEKYKKQYPDIIKFFVMNREDIIDPIPSIRVSNIIKKAFKIASGNYFCILSADDKFIDMNKFSFQINFLEEHKNYSSCYTDFKKFWNDESEVVIKQKASISNSLFWAYKYVHISCFVFNRKVLNFVLDNFCDDTGLIYSIFLAGKSKHLDKITFGYRQRDKSIMHEADKVELSIIELLLYNDILKKNKYLNSSLSRFSKPIKYLYDNRKQIENDKYKKYIKYSLKDNTNNLLLQLKNYDSLNKKDKIKIRVIIIKSAILRKIFLFMGTISMKINYFIGK
ncbi:MAG: glycosyltransferase family 2 protein [Clostridia bacterium]|nr:glycosyltransferase family 2 protein [Clostridia bacterium]